MSNIKIYIVIATSKKRTELLINRSLQSIYSQKKINSKNIEIIIVDDNIRMQENSVSEEYIKIKEKIELLRTKFEFSKNEYKTHLLSNTRTQFNSGTGAWNTAINFIKNKRDNNASYTAILDDDDEYKENYFYEIIKKCKSNTVAIFTTIIWRGNDFERVHYIEKEKLTPKDFFIGNPGVQGSNMFFSSDILEMIGGFDENMPSTTDRDLMIRFLDYLNQNNISKDLILVLDEPLVIHNAMGTDRVTDNLILKKRGLDIFYNKYKIRFTKLDFKSSIERAKKLFKYEYQNRKIVIGMPLKNGAKTIKRAVASILNQKNLRRELLLIIANDNSTDNWNDELKEFENDNRIIIINVNFGKSYKVRNYINSFIREHIPDVEYIGRLDSDDYIIDDQTVSKIEFIMDSHNSDIIFLGNKLSINNQIIDRINIADKRLLLDDFLFIKLKQMSEGVSIGELPSCNTFIKPSVLIDYKDIDSAEDHWFSVFLLLNKYKYSIFIADNLLYSVYSLNGQLSNENKHSDKYLQSRKLLLKYFLEKINDK